MVPELTGRDPSVDPRYDLAGWELIGRVMRLKRTLPHAAPSLVDLGMGRGRDAIYFARRGFQVLGIELSPLGILRAERRAARYSIPLETLRADLRTVRLPQTFDVVFSSTALNHLLPSVRRRRFAHFQERTRPGGIHAVNAFVRDSDRGPPPEPGSNGTLFRPGELRGYYDGWEVLESGVRGFDCLAPGPTHRHPVDVLVARKPGSDGRRLPRRNSTGPTS
jgi:tellurite methyltransferase